MKYITSWINAGWSEFAIVLYALYLDYAHPVLS